jgi:hypothetical protein
VRCFKTSCSQLVPVRGGPITKKEGSRELSLSLFLI